MNLRIILITLFIIISISCITDSKTKAVRKTEHIQPDSILDLGKEPKTRNHELKTLPPDCASVKFKFFPSEDGFYIYNIVVLNNSTKIDTLQVHNKKITPWDSGEVKIIIEDINFDNACDLVIVDDGSASHGTMSYYYYLFDKMTGKFIENKSLPERAGGIKVDVVNKGITIYCSYMDCKGLYKFTNNEFALTEGEYTNEGSSAKAVGELKIE